MRNVEKIKDFILEKVKTGNLSLSLEKTVTPTIGCNCTDLYDFSTSEEPVTIGFYLDKVNNGMYVSVYDTTAGELVRTALELTDESVRKKPFPCKPLFSFRIFFEGKEIQVQLVYEGREEPPAEVMKQKRFKFVFETIRSMALIMREPFEVMHVVHKEKIEEAAPASLAV